MARFGVVGGHGERFGGGVVVQPLGGGGIGLLQDVEQQTMQAAGGDVFALNGGAVRAEGDGELLHRFQAAGSDVRRGRCLRNNMAFNFCRVRVIAGMVCQPAQGLCVPVGCPVVWPPPRSRHRVTKWRMSL